MARREGACLSHTCRSYMPCSVLFGLITSPVTYRLTCSKPSSRQKTERNLAIPWAIVSGTRVIGSIGASLGLYFTRLSSPFSPVRPTTFQVGSSEITADVGKSLVSAKEIAIGSHGLLDSRRHSTDG